MTLTFGVFLLFLHRGVVGNLPPCFSNQTTWHSNDMIDAVQNIDTAFICQELCAVSNCSGFTWYSEHSEYFPRICALYHTLSREEPCSDCISGPASCTCSGSFGCAVTSDDVIDIFTSTESETRCQNLCFNTPGCNFYSYYNYLNVMQDFCYIFNSCDQTDDACTGCFSGPPVCSPSTTPRPTSTPRSTSSPRPTSTPRPTTSPTSFADPCIEINYKVLDDKTRSVNYDVPDIDEDYCDNMGHTTSPDWRGAGWYRLQEPAGLTIPEYPPDESRCGTDATGWLQGEHPHTLSEEVTRTVCFNWNGAICWTSAVITVKNCGDYFLYNLPNVPTCAVRYCGV